MNCKICNDTTKLIFKTKVLSKYNACYFQCNKCQFIQTEDPYWLDEAYNHAITKLDIGLISRNINFSNITEKILINHFNPHNKFLDFGGGYGIYVRLMRDKGFDFYRYDIYCQNLFAEFFDITDISIDTKFEVLTAFEVFEHFIDPKKELEKMLDYSSNIIFSTELQPYDNITPQNWWYLIPETGQHISLFSYNSLVKLAMRYKLNIYSNHTSLHIFAKEKLQFNPFSLEKKNYINRILHKLRKKEVKLDSLLMKDFDLIKKKIHENII